MPNPHRHRTLILNNTPGYSNPATGNLASNPAQNKDTNPDQSEPLQAANGWVTKRDRHMQLINSSIYDKETQVRHKAIEETRKQKAARKDQREMQKLERHLKTLTPDHSKSVAVPTIHEITINGLRFHVLNGGSKLARIRGEDPWEHKTCIPILII